MLISFMVILLAMYTTIFERTREIGILSAVGMRAGRIMSLFLSESALLAVGGAIMGIILGVLSTFLFKIKGFYIGGMGLTGFMLGDTIFAKLTMANIVNLSIVTFIVTVLAGLYPAIMASRMQPVEALRAEK
jgi:putative ABC transport system permease protein